MFKFILLRFNCLGLLCNFPNSIQAIDIYTLCMAIENIQLSVIFSTTITIVWIFHSSQFPIPPNF